MSNIYYSNTENTLQIHHFEMTDFYFVALPLICASGVAAVLFTLRLSSLSAVNKDAFAGILRVAEVQRGDDEDNEDEDERRLFISDPHRAAGRNQVSTAPVQSDTPPLLLLIVFVG